MSVAGSELAKTGDAPHPWLTIYLERLALEPQLDVAIHDSDEMLLHAQLISAGDRDAGLVSYFEDGRQVVLVLDQIVGAFFGTYREVDSMLDFGCGFGRLTRWLVRRLRAQSLWAADILPEAVRYQHERFGVHALESTARPEDWSPEQRFDFIWVGSLFTHLPESTFRRWLEKLLDLLGPHGVLAFTVHDASLVPPGHELPGNGFLFLEDSESQSLAKSDYGSCWVSEDFVASQISDTEVGREGSWRRFPRAVCRYQDLYLVARGDGAKRLHRFDLDAGPLCAVETLEADAPDRESLPVVVDGWAAYSEAAFRVEAIELTLDGALVDRCEAFRKRVDLVEHFGSESFADVGFECRASLEAPLERSRVLLGVTARSSSGLAWPLYLGSLEAGVRYVLRQKVEALKRRERALESHIAWMRSSRFWRMREGWFALKRRLGVTEEA